MVYGLTLSSIIGWFAFFDIGFGNGLRNKFAEAIAKGDHQLGTYLFKYNLCHIKHNHC